MLVIYSHFARPYAITLFLSYVGLYAFYRYLDAPDQKMRWDALYVVCASLGIWLHLVTAPFLLAPFLLEGCRWLLTKRAGRPGVLLSLALPVVVLVTALVAPALINAFRGLVSKTGNAEIGLETIQGAWFMWLGTPSLACVVILLAFTLIGMRSLLASDRIAQSAALGLVLTLLLIFLTSPNWVNHSLTFGRYLLPAIPFLLLASACGMARLAGGQGISRGIAYTLGVLLTALYLAHSPVWALIARPNSHINHAQFQFDFRPSHNVSAQILAQNLEVSPFWDRLSDEPADSLRIAVAPFYYPSFFWDGPRREQHSRQRIIPALRNGFCTNNKQGEVPINERFRFRNVFHLAELDSISADRPDWVVYTLPFKAEIESEEGAEITAEAERCIAELRNALGNPEFEDDSLLAFRVSD